MKLTKTNIDGIMRDPVSKAYINKNYAEYDKIVMQRKHDKEIGALKDQLEEVSTTLDKVSELEEMIKKMLRNSNADTG